MIENVARAINNAICDDLGCDRDDDWQGYIPVAKAAIAAMTVHADPQWQGIESAPRDGMVIDVWRDGHRETVYWGLPPHTCGEMGECCDSDWHRIKGLGWVCSTFGEFLGGKHNPFTHWMPLPTPPAGGSDE